MTVKTPIAILAALLALLACAAAPALAAAPETPELTVEDTTSAVATPSIEARLHGILNPKAPGEAGTYQFLYKASKSGACEGGGVAPVPPGMSSGFEYEEYYETITGLTSNTEYAVCLRVESTATKEVTVTPAVTFITPIPPEKPETEAASENTTGTTATLHGELNPHSTAKDGYDFTYNTNGTCEPGATTTPGTETTATKREVSTAVTGLEGSTEYTFCAVETNAAGESATGEPLKFKTPASKPVVVSQGDSGVTPFAAILEGQVNPENQETTYHLEYATAAAKLGTTEATTLAYGIVGPGISATQPVGLVRYNQNHEPEPEPVSGLTPNTTYYYRVVAKNATGETEGTEAEPIGEFTTLVAETPSVTGERLIGASFQEGTDTIEAQLNPEYQGTSCEVQYVTEKVFLETGFTENVAAAGCSPVPPATEFGQGSSPIAFTAKLTGLQENTAYEYRVVASNGTGTFAGPEQLLARKPPRLTGATEVSEVTQELARIEPAPIVPEVQAPLEAGYYVTYGTATADEHTSADVGIGSGLTPNIAGPVGLSNLEPGTTYRYEVVAYNGNAKITGPELTFTTSPSTPPLLSGVSVSGVTQGAATIAATLEPNGLLTRYELQLGTTPGQLQPASFGDATGTTPLSLPVGSLSPGTTYYYKLIATNQDGSNEPEGSFTTAPGPGAAPSPGLPALIPYTTIAQYRAKEPKAVKTVTTKPVKCKKGFTKKHDKCVRVKKKRKGKKKGGKKK